MHARLALPGMIVIGALLALLAASGTSAVAREAEHVVSCCAGGPCGPAEPVGAGEDTDACPGGCGSCALPCCSGAVFAPPTPDAPLSRPDAPPARLAPSAVPWASRLAATDLDRPPRT